MSNRILNPNPKVAAQVARETEETERVINMVWNHTMRFTARQIESGTYPVIQIPHLGKFVPMYGKMNNKSLKDLLPKADKPLK